MYTNISSLCNIYKQKYFIWYKSKSNLFNIHKHDTSQVLFLWLLIVVGNKSHFFSNLRQRHLKKTQRLPIKINCRIMFKLQIIIVLTKHYKRV